MRRRIRHIARATLVVLAVTAGAAVLPTPAQAADWNQSIQGVVRADRLFAHPDGKVTVAACGAPSGDTLQAKTFDTTGSTGYVNEVANGNSPKLYACVGQSTIGKDGTLYASGYYSGQSYERLVAYKNNAQKWNVQLPNSCSTFHSIAMGVNGNIYVVGGSCSGSTYRLIGFTPEVASGQTVPSVVLNVAVNNYFYGNTGDFLAAHDDGLVVQLNNGLQFFDYAGNTSGAVQPADFAKGHDSAIVTNTNGRTFYPVTASTNQQTLCSSSGGYIHSSVVGHSPGGADWLYTFTECEHVWFVRATYDGGAIIDTWRTSETATPLGRWLTAVDGFGNMKWSIRVEDPNGDFSALTHSITTTLNGDVLLASVLNERTNNPVNDNRVALNLYSGGTGQNIGHKLFEGTAYGYGFAGPDDLAALANGRAYVALVECNYTSCSGNRKLHAVDMAAMTPGYPRGAVLTSDEPWLDYVALGDSFSSGEGVPPFLNGTDTAGPPENRCHRSEKAYGRLVNGNPNMRLNLTAFGTCSGARSAQITGTWPAIDSDSPNTNEPAQISHLSSSTKVVTITIGGNDAEFAKFGRRCVLADCSIYRQYYLTLANSLTNLLASAYDEILSEAPNAKVYVLGYPLMLSPDGCNQTDEWMHALNVLAGQAAVGNAPAILALQALAASNGLDSYDESVLLTSGSVQISQDELDLAHDFTTAINQKTSTVVGTKGSRIEFINPMDSGSPFLGHELCTDDEYFHPIVPGGNASFTFHPNTKGQNAYADLLIRNL
ncbi:MAG TPA: SGNH/GDSL hydrolase family protein [Candidatus Saccharimonadales bacterium]|nr:SGNH/GDSL hydrolase family protein [Candidatus Saccharimonadales bacterium]